LGNRQKKNNKKEEIELENGIEKAGQSLISAKRRPGKEGRWRRRRLKVLRKKKVKGKKYGSCSGGKEPMVGGKKKSVGLLLLTNTGAKRWEGSKMKIRGPPLKESGYITRKVLLQGKEEKASQLS